jgi:hypothetical protein
MSIKASDFAPTGDSAEPPSPAAEAEFEDSQIPAKDEPGGADSPSGSPLPEEPFGVSSSLTPSGLEVYYQAGPKRLYRVRHTKHAMDEYDWVEVPSVTTVNGVIDKSGALTWWGQGIGALGTLRLQALGVDLGTVLSLLAAGALDDARKAVCDLLTANKISTNHVRDDASDRGVNVHAAFEQWANDQRITPQPIVFEEHEQGYVQGLRDFLTAITVGEPTEIEAEVMVASLKRRFAGRYDLRLRLNKPAQIVTRTYPVRKDKVEEIPAGTYLLDLKTSKDVYDTHYLQLEAYEGASVECGYEPTDYRGVIHVTAGGKYELHVNQLKNDKQPWDFDDFLVARELYRVMNEVKRR